MAKLSANVMMKLDADGKIIAVWPIFGPVPVIPALFAPLPGSTKIVSAQRPDAKTDDAAILKSFAIDVKSGKLTKA